MICPACGGNIPDGYTRCAACGVDLGVALGLQAASGPSEVRAGDPNRPYVVWRGWPWATLSTVSQTRSQFVTSLSVGLAASGIAILAMVLIGQWVLGALFALLFGGSAYVGWRVGRRGAGWK